MEEETAQLAEVLQLIRTVDGSTTIPDGLREKLGVMLKRLRRMARQGESSEEYEAVAKYIDWCMTVPWNQYVQDNQDLAQVLQIMDQMHYGHSEVKDLILEYLALMNRKNSLGSSDITSPVLAFVGVQGAGKTSLAKSIATALGRPFARISLGAVGDSSQLRGTPYQRVSAEPGQVMKAICQSKAMNPVILLDEFDKVSGREELRKDFMAIMLEILDPQQNKTFRDQYFDYPFDLSRVLFIATANSFKTISRELLDRLDIIQFEDYSFEEKAIIAKQYIFPTVLDYSGLHSNELQITDEAWIKMTEVFGVDAGVRRYERNLQKLARGILKKIILGEISSLTIDGSNVNQFTSQVLPSIKEIRNIDYTANE